MTNALKNRITGQGEEAPDKLLANPLNWRRHPKNQQDALEGMLRTVGWVQRVIVNRTTGHIVDGHLRVEVARRRKEPTVPVLYVELTPKEEKIVLAAIDPIGGLAETDQAMLDDLLPGGTKMRAIMPLIASSMAGEFVYASPAQGYAQVALAHCTAALGRRATVFTAERKVPHPLTMRAKAAGAKIVQVGFGRLNVIQSRAKRYTQEVGAMLVPFGCDVPLCRDAIAEAARQIDAPPDEVWTVAGSGVLTRSLQAAWPKAKFYAVAVGSEKANTGRAIRIDCPVPFEDNARVFPPFPSARNYDAKAWEYIKRQASPGALFWNVGA